MLSQAPPPTSEEFKAEFDAKFQDSSFNELLEQRKSLPVYSYKKSIMDAVRASQVIIIRGATGCGKTTQVPQYVLDEYIMSGDGVNCNVVVTQVRIFLDQNSPTNLSWHIAKILKQNKLSVSLVIKRR